MTVFIHVRHKRMMLPYVGIGRFILILAANQIESEFAQIEQDRPV